MGEQSPVSYESMRCRFCRRPVEPNLELIERLGGRLAVSSREDCIYACACGVSYTNARSEAERVLIMASPETNVPRQVRSGLSEALSQAAGRKNLKKKLLRFCFETSEDAIIWTVLRGLEQQGRLDALVAAGRLEGEPTVLIWGAPVSGSRRLEVASALAEVCRSLGETPGSYTEPDAIVLWPSLAVAVEARLRTPNDCRPVHGGFERYFDRKDLFAVPPETVARAGYYELTRLWRVGIGLAERLDAPAFLFVNLGPPDLLEASALTFSNLLNRWPGRDFAWCSWNDLLESAAPLEPWLERYVSDRHRLLYWR